MNEIKAFIMYVTLHVCCFIYLSFVFQVTNAWGEILAKQAFISQIFQNYAHVSMTKDLFRTMGRLKKPIDICVCCNHGWLDPSMFIHGQIETNKL